MTYTPSLGRWLELDPIGFDAGDANLYRFVGNNPTNAVDPSGLWSWRLDPTGNITVVSEANDTLNGLIGLGYPATTIADLGKKGNVDGLDTRLNAGITLDVTNLFPESVRRVLARQQRMDFEKLRSRVENTAGGPKNVPKGKTVGTSGIDLLQPSKTNDAGRDVTRPYGDNQFGMGNCYGFVGLCLGQQLPTRCTPENYSLIALKSERVAGDGLDKAGREEKDWKENGGLQVLVAPEGGLLKSLVGGSKQTERPLFGDVALFKNSLGISHAAFVLGRNRAGDVIILQKINSAAPYGISSVTHPLLAGFGEPTFYHKEMK